MECKINKGKECEEDHNGICYYCYRNMCGEDLWKCPICSDYFKNKEEHIALEIKQLKRDLKILSEL